jgi:hypothetical protein
MVAGPDGQATPASPEQTMMAQQASPVQTPLLDPSVIDQMRQGEQRVRDRLVTEAYGTKLPQRRVPDGYEK